MKISTGEKVISSPQVECVGRLTLGKFRREEKVSNTEPRMLGVWSGKREEEREMKKKRGKKRKRKRKKGERQRVCVCVDCRDKQQTPQSLTVR